MGTDHCCVQGIVVTIRTAVAMCTRVGQATSQLSLVITAAMSLLRMLVAGNHRTAELVARYGALVVVAVSVCTVV